MRKFISIGIFLILSYTMHAQGVGAERIINRYLEVTNAFRSGDVKQVKSTAALLKASLFIYEDLSSSERKVYALHVKQLLYFADQLSATGNLELQRRLLANISPAIWELAKSAGETVNNYTYLYCPMRKAYWVSEKMEVSNPYYSGTMEACGNIYESISKQ